MTTSPHESLPLIPRWQIAIVLVGFPVLYLINSFLPWTQGLFVRQDRSQWFPFWISVALLHWSSVGLTIFFLRRAGHSVSSIGMNFSPRTLTLIVGLPIAVGIVVVLIRSLLPDPTTGRASPMQMFYPTTTIERLGWILMSMTAGFCEEFVYRGFGISALQARGHRRWSAALLTNFAFVFIHGLAGIFLFPMYLAVGLGFAALFLYTGRLTHCIALHALIDVFAILGR